MTRIKYFFLYIACAALIASGTAHAETDNLLSEEPVAAPQSDGATIQTVASDEQPEESISARNLSTQRSRIKLSAFGGLNFSNYSLGGTGLNSSFYSTGLFLLGGALRVKPSQDSYTAGARFIYSQITHDLISTVSPSWVRASQLSVLGDVTMHPFQKFERLGLSLGYAFMMRTVTETTPRVMGGAIAHGPLIGARYHTAFLKHWVMESSVNLIFPISHRETGLNTGFRNIALGGEALANILYYFNSRFAAGIGIMAGLNAVYFSGSGSRGVTDARELDWIYSIPLELRLCF
ncbi:MAG: hypothetical protein A2583_00960 [Bdellovibrionales bacterium RIFOXYD1_FULL_53_11]|nr:MAG: hypothetical protein A2583_00960 [Bdellovibrionales bacterium RIFOXYD1_FULL_53_11]